MISRRCAVVGIMLSLMSTAKAAATEIATSPGPVALTAEPTRIVLRPVDAVDIAAALAQTPGRRFSLVLSGIAADQPPATGYLVFLNVPPGATPGPQDLGLAGPLSFFGVPPASGGSGRTVSFEISDVLARLQAAGRLDDGLTITIAPAGKPKSESRPTIARIALFAE
jgi:hypothetical protein